MGLESAPAPKRRGSQPPKAAPDPVIAPPLHIREETTDAQPVALAPVELPPALDPRPPQPVAAPAPANVEQAPEPDQQTWAPTEPQYVSTPAAAHAPVPPQAYDTHEAQYEAQYSASPMSNPGAYSHSEMEGEWYREEEPSTSPKEKRRMRKSAGKERPSVSGSVSSRRRNRRIISGTIIAGVAISGLSFVWTTTNSFLNPSVTQAEAQRMASQFVSDGSFAPYESAGREFLTAYITSPTSELQLEEQLSVMQRLSGGQASQWTEGIVVPKGKATRIVAGPELMIAPARSETVAGAISMLFSVTTVQGSGSPQQEWFGVVASKGEDNRVFIALPPSLMPPPLPAEGDGVEVPQNQAIATAAESNLAEFFTLWGQFRDGASDSQRTRLGAFVTADPSPTVFLGLDKKASFREIVKISVTATGPEEAPTGAQGLVVVSWELPSGEIQYSSYRVVLVNDASRWLVDGITPA